MGTFLSLWVFVIGYQLTISGICFEEFHFLSLAPRYLSGPNYCFRVLLKKCKIIYFTPIRINRKHDEFLTDFWSSLYWEINIGK